VGASAEADAGLRTDRLSRGSLRGVFGVLALIGRPVIAVCGPRRGRRQVIGQAISALAGDAASHFFQVVRRRCEHGSIVLTTNRHIADWGQVFDDTTVAAAILDRLVHHATVLSHQRRQLPHARPPRRHQHAPLSDHRWGILVITPGEIA
jgi:IstB-like ATP binding protein